MLSCRRKQTKSRENDEHARENRSLFETLLLDLVFLFPSLFLTVTMHGCFLDVFAAFSWGGGGGGTADVDKENRPWQGLHSLSWPLEKSVGAILGRFSLLNSSVVAPCSMSVLPKQA